MIHRGDYLHTKKNIAATLKRARIQSGKSLAAFADDLALPKTTLKNYMKMGVDEHKANPTIESLELIAERLDMTVVQLISDPHSLRHSPPECADCSKVLLHSLHPALKKEAESMLELFCALSSLLYELDDQKIDLS